MKTIHTFGALSAAVREGFNLIVSKPSTFIVTVTVKGGDRARARAHASHVHASCVLEDGGDVSASVAGATVEFEFSYPEQVADFIQALDDPDHL